MFERYGLIGCMKLIISLIYTKLFFPQARLIRLPFDIRNKRFTQIGKSFTTGFGCRIEAHPLSDFKSKCIIIGDNVEINDYVHIAAGEKIVIGSNTLIASKVFISDINHGSYSGPGQDTPLTAPNGRKLSAREIHIGDNVWIGESVCVLPGITIGSGSIIGALSVVTKNVPPYSIAAGNPARVIKTYNFQTKNWEHAGPAQ